MFRRFVALMTSTALVIATMPAPLAAQPAPAPVAAPDQTQQGEQFSTAQLEALLAPIALYPDTLLTQLLMATTNPLEIVAASRWLAQGSNRDAHRQGAGGRAAKPAMGPRGEVAGPVPAGAGHAQPAARMDPAARLRHAEPGIRGVRRGPAPARAGANDRLTANDAAAGREHRAGTAAASRRDRSAPAEHRHRAGRSEPRLRPELRSLAGLWRVALCRRAAGLLRAAARLRLSERAGGGARVRRRRSRLPRRAVGLGPAELGLLLGWPLWRA